MYHGLKRTFPSVSVISEEHDAAKDSEATMLPVTDEEVERYKQFPTKRETIVFSFEFEFSG